MTLVNRIVDARPCNVIDMLRRVRNRRTIIIIINRPINRRLRASVSRTYVYIFRQYLLREDSITTRLPRGMTRWHTAYILTGVLLECVASRPVLGLRLSLATPRR